MDDLPLGLIRVVVADLEDDSPVVARVEVVRPVAYPGEVFDFELPGLRGHVMPASERALELLNGKPLRLKVGVNVLFPVLERGQGDRLLVGINSEHRNVQYERQPFRPRGFVGH